MSILEKVTSAVTGGRKREPAGTIHVVDPSPLNWLYITYNTVEELVRVDRNRVVGPAAMKSFHWANDHTLEVELREDERFPDGEAFTAATVKRAFDEVAERARPREWDLLVMEHGAQAADGPPLEFHRAFVGWNGEFTAGPPVPEFEALYTELVRETSVLKQTRISYRIDRLVHEEAPAIFLCAPETLYAVNRHVDFTAYRTTFELAECQVSEEHWSRR